MVLPTEKEMRKILDERHTNDIQVKISDARVAICGIGGLGSMIAMLLAKTGVGTLHLIDFDQVELSNINRQQYYISQVGQYKTDALVEIIKQSAPYCKVITTKKKLDEENISQLLANDTMICEAFDNAENKAFLVNYILEKRVNAYLVAASGMAGYGANNQIKTRKINSHFYLCGDEISECNEKNSLMAPRVALCAAHQANQILELIIDQNEMK